METKSQRAASESFLKNNSTHASYALATSTSIAKLSYLSGSKPSKTPTKACHRCYLCAYERREKSGGGDDLVKCHRSERAQFRGYVAAADEVAGANIDEGATSDAITFLDDAFGDFVMTDVSESISRSWVVRMNKLQMVSAF